MSRARKRVLIVAAMAVLGLVAALGGYAYWTSGGAGNGSATAGSTTAVTLHASFASGFYPGWSGPVSFTVDNPNPGDVHVGTVHVASVGVDAGHAACDVADFTMPDVVQNVEVANGNGHALPNGGTLSFADTAVSQDACKGATITLNLTSS
jgi:hypothetical protein